MDPRTEVLSVNLPESMLSARDQQDKSGGQRPAARIQEGEAMLNTPRHTRFRARAFLALCLVLAMSVLGLAAGCGDDDGGDSDSAEVEAAFLAAVDAWNGKDVEGFLASFTDAGLMASFDSTREEAEQFLPDFIGEEQLTPGEFTVDVSGDTATVEAPQFALGNVLDPMRSMLILQNGVWLFDGEEDIAAEIPEGTTAVDVSLREYAFDFDAGAITDGNVAFRLTNEGAEDHEMFLSRIPEDLDIEQALQSEEPEGTVDIGGTDVAAGESANLVFTEPLAAGRYAVLCFFESPDGEPHALLGMWSEFTIE
jgi:uncharacterized cupredoxin-like copper-binding protein